MYKKDEKGNRIHWTAQISNNVELGYNNVIEAYAVIGGNGFIRGENEYVGKVIIGDNNRIGSHVTIMRGVEGTTSIGNNNLIMNKVNIGHNSTIGNDNEIGCGTIIPGWVNIGNECRIKIGVIIRNKVIIRDNSFIAMGSVVTKDLDGNASYMGIPAKKRNI